MPTGRSGCASYNAHMIIEPGQTPASSVLSPQTKQFLNRLLVGEPSLATITGVGDTELYAGQITARIHRLTGGREVESERWQEAFRNLSADITGSRDPMGM